MSEEHERLKNKLAEIAWQLTKYIDSDMLPIVGTVFGALAGARVPRDLADELLDVSYDMDACIRAESSEKREGTAN